MAPTHLHRCLRVSALLRRRCWAAMRVCSVVVFWSQAHCKCTGHDVSPYACRWSMILVARCLNAVRDRVVLSIFGAAPRFVAAANVAEASAIFNSISMALRVGPIELGGFVYMQSSLAPTPFQPSHPHIFYITTSIQYPVCMTVATGQRSPAHACWR